MTNIPYDASKWYWQVGDDDAQVWSSAKPGYVPLDDAAYAAWIAAGGVPTPIATFEELEQVFAEQYPGGSLQTYNPHVRSLTLNGGIVVSGRPFATDPLTTGSLNSAYIYTQGDAAATFSWKLPDGTFVTLAKQDVAQLQAAVSKYGQDCFDCEADTNDAIAAGTITSREQVDAAFAAVPNSFTGVVLQDRKPTRRRK